MKIVMKCWTGLTFYLFSQCCLINSIIQEHEYKILFIIWASAWDFQQCGMCNQQSLKSACAYAQSDQSLCKLLEYSMNVKLLSKHHLEFLSLKGGCTGLYESILVKMPHCWKSHVAAHMTLKVIWNYTFSMQSSRFCHYMYMRDVFMTFIAKRILHEWSCFIEFIKRVGENR